MNLITWPSILLLWCQRVGLFLPDSTASRAPTHRKGTSTEGTDEEEKTATPTANGAKPANPSTPSNLREDAVGTDHGQGLEVCVPVSAGCISVCKVPGVKMVGVGKNIGTVTSVLRARV
ncbi:hypothetical protein BDP55DRAFT_62800 [Colletotrichum godetiae]|uniref:Secreted protein n=1 Tax=Colletotrichum godetiae TaxID=1209918 RepID=A0AAJ0F081_9PEZI|nr:uncharacterized protein BDP55DRAFT_62800 [Colletotrichum godetiae]KAK1688258.1 hypothetical protein BDP55DRAFT_62800 [Colletotrichum godetiae]